jgi:bifunctional DNA-binding transcriptional regulator/antitoxin component of YhaV-PrlF toxin-antitoxin module
MEEVQLKMDSKGRICLPSEIREEMGDIVVATRTPKGILIRPSKRKDFIEEFRRVITSEPERTGEPENWSPEKMKEIWESRG